MFWGFVIIFILLLIIMEIRISVFKKKVGFMFSTIGDKLENVFNQDFYDKLKNDVKKGLNDFFEELQGFNYEILDELSDIQLLVKVHWEQKQASEMFDFSLKDSKGIVGLEIWTTFEAPKEYKDAEIDLNEAAESDICIVPDATLLYVCGKPESEEQQDLESAHWIWPDQLAFLIGLQDGLNDEGESIF